MHGLLIVLVQNLYGQREMKEKVIVWDLLRSFETYFKAKTINSILSEHASVNWNFCNTMEQSVFYDYLLGIFLDLVYSLQYFAWM